MRSLVVLFFLSTVMGSAASATVEDVMNWMRSFSEKGHFEGIPEGEPDGYTCELNVYPGHFPYISLCIKQSPEAKDSLYCIGMAIKPGSQFRGQYQEREMRVDQDVHARVFWDEIGPNGENLTGVENDLVIERDTSGRITGVRATSSYFKRVRCIPREKVSSPIS